MTRFRPVKAYRAEKRYRALAQRMLDYTTANAADDGTLPFDPRGAVLTHKRAFWVAVACRFFNGKGVAA